MQTTAVINQKGGVGKTTTVMNLGAALGLLGRRVLLIDLDPQANLSAHLGVFDSAPGAPTSYQVLVDEVPLSESILPTAEENVFLVPSTRDLAGAELELVSAMGRETRLKEALAALEKTAKPAFDDILVDCPPSLGLLSLNALAAADRVLVPLQAEFFGLQGYARLMDIITLVQRRLNPRLVLGGIVACKVDRRARITNDVLDEVKKWAGESFFESMIRPNVKLSEATSHGRSVFRYAAASNGAEDYLALAREFVQRASGVVVPEAPAAWLKLVQDQKDNARATARAMKQAWREAVPVPDLEPEVAKSQSERELEAPAAASVRSRRATQQPVTAAAEKPAAAGTKAEPRPASKSAAKSAAKPTAAETAALQVAAAAVKPAATVKPADGTGASEATPRKSPTVIRSAARRVPRSAKPEDPQP